MRRVDALLLLVEKRQVEELLLVETRLASLRVASRVERCEHALVLDLSRPKNQHARKARETAKSPHTAS